MKNKIVNFIIYSSVFLINILLDQITKYFARLYLKGKGVINIIGDFFILVYAENDGAFLSFGSNLMEPIKTILLTVFPVVVILSLTVWVIISKKLSRWEKIFMWCVLGGGYSNIIDRIIYNGYVTDFLNFGIGNIRTGILNVADLSITFGFILFFVAEYVSKKKVSNSKEEK